MGNQDFKNLYEVTKTVRFELRPKNREVDRIIKKYLGHGDISNLLDQFNSIRIFFLDIFCYKNDFEKEQKIVFRKNRKIKYNWLRTYTKNKFYDWCGEVLVEKNKKLREKGEKEITIENLDRKPYLFSASYLPEEFLRWMNEWQELTERLEEFTTTKEEKQKRHSEIAFVLRGFLKRQNFEFIRGFASAVMDLQNEKGNEDDKKLQKLRELLFKTYENLKSCEKEYLPTQSGGLLLHKASLNYYTLNKTPKDYSDLREDKKSLLYDPVSQELNRDNSLKIKWFYRDKKNRAVELFIIDKDFFKKIKVNNDVSTANTIDSLYFALKNWKAKQKSEFIEAVAGDKLTVQNFREKFPIFDTLDDNFEKFYRLTKELDTNPENAKDIAQQRGNFFNKPREGIQTENYYKLCELFKRIAMKRGKILAEIKGLKNEEVQSQFLDHWAVIIQERERRFVVMVPRGEKENHKKTHEYIDEHFSEDDDGEIIFYHFKSLTLRALEKLCFKKFNNTFVPEIRKEGIEFPKYKEEGRKDNKEEYDKKMISFYQKILQSKYAQKYLDLVDFGGLQNFLNSEFTELEKFESALEKVCYIKTPLKVSVEQKENFIKKFNAKVFEMTTRSISKESKRKENKHAEVWRNFWSDKNETEGYITRLNPEMSIFYREEIKEKSNKGKTKKGVENRFSKPRFTLATTVTLNATSKKLDLAFKTTQDIKDHIDEFNTKFNESFDDEWVYGIDRGIKELATLNVVKFSDKKNEFGVSKPKEFAKIAVWILKDENADLKDKSGNIIKNAKGENRKIIDNISEVLKDGVEPDGKLFEKDTISSIDLTQAKLIKGHIILNGDKKTYLKLKELSAKRRIFELFSTSKIDKNSEIKISKTIRIIGKKYEYPIYWLTDEQKVNQQKQELEKMIKDYLSTLDKKNKFEDIETIEEINHLRDAITANMVGIIAHLQKQFPGIIALENMEAEEHIEKHFRQSNENISRRMEWALYRKFQTEGLVPPQIRQSIFIRDKFKKHQFGIVKFVKIGYTSRSCPRCEAVWKKMCDVKCKICEDCEENKKYKKNKSSNIYVCKESKCGFSSKDNRLEFEPLDNSDKVAAFNVAKNTFKEIYE